MAEALDIHPLMLSRWRQEAREGRLRGSETQTAVAEGTDAGAQAATGTGGGAALLQEEHELLKKAIRFCSEQKADVFAFIDGQREASR